MIDDNVPMWARKPKHKDKVVATSKGWTVDKTGEILVSVKNLDQKLAEYLGVGSVTFDDENSQIILHDNEIKVTELPTSPIFVDGEPKPVIKVEDELIAVPTDEAAMLIEVPQETETVVVDTPVTTNEVVEAVETPVTLTDKEEKVVVKEEPAKEAVEVAVKKKPGRPKKVLVTE